MARDSTRPQRLTRSSRHVASGRLPRPVGRGPRLAHRAQLHPAAAGRDSPAGLTALVKCGACGDVPARRTPGSAGRVHAARVSRRADRPGPSRGRAGRDRRPRRRRLASGARPTRRWLEPTLGGLRETLVELLAHLEAGLDFVEEDIRFISREEIQNQLDDAEAIVARIAEQLTGRDRRDALPVVVLTGPPTSARAACSMPWPKARRRWWPMNRAPRAII